MNNLKVINKKILFGLMIVSILIIGIGVYAFGIKNVGTYNAEEKTMVIKESALDNSIIAEVTLNYGENVNLIRGYRRFAEIKIDSLEKDFKKIVNKLDLYNVKKDMKKFERQIDYKYKKSMGFEIIDDYEEVCQEKYNSFNGTMEMICANEKVGEHEEELFEWINIDENTILSEGKIIIGLYTNILPDEKVEWIPTILSTRIPQWAVWTEALNTDLISYWKLDESVGAMFDELDVNNGTDNGMTRGGGGLIGNAYEGDGAGQYATFTDIDFTGFSELTWSVWVYPHDVTGPDGVVSGLTGDYGPNIIINVANARFQIDAVATCTGSIVLSNNNWYHLIGNWNGTDITLFVNGTEDCTASFAGPLQAQTSFFLARYHQANTYDFDGLIDEVGLWNRTLSQAEITQVFNEGAGITYDSFPISGTTLTVTLNAPENNSFHSTNPLSFNASYTYTNLNTTNATYYIYDSSGIFNKTTVTLTAAANSSILNISDFTIGDYEWNVYACGINTTGTLCNWSATGNYTFEWRPFEIDSQTYNGEVYETSRQKFELNITTIPSILSVSSKLIYNKTSHSASSSCVAGECTITKSIDIPLVNAGKSQNKTFYFNLTFYDGTNSYNFDTSNTIGSQNVSRIYFEVCNATYLTKTMNFTIYDERNLTKVTDFEIGATFFTWLGQGTIKRNQSFDKSPVNSTAFCLVPNKTHYTDAEIEYDTYKVNSTTYVKRNYYLQNHSFTNVLQNISLYLLTAEDSTSFIQVVQDQKLSPVVGALILTQRYYPGDNTYRTVQVSKTDDNGESIGFYEAEIAQYKHLITLRGITLLETILQKVVGKSVPYTLTFTIGDALTIPWSPWEEDPNIVTSLTYNDTSKLVTFSYIDSTEETDFGNLLVLQEFPNNNTITTICNTSSIQPSATLTCNMTGYEGTFISKGIIGTDKSIVDILQFIISTARDILGNTGLVIGFFIILTAGMIFIWNPVAGIVGINAAMWFVSMIGFITFPPIFLYAILGVSIITIILLKT